jgi:hypothetical protein
MVFLGGLVRFFDEVEVGDEVKVEVEAEVEVGNETGKSAHRRWLVLSACGLALAVTSSSLAYGLLLSLALAWLVLVWLSPSRITHHVSRITYHVSRIIPVFVLVALALSTGLGWNPAGLGASGDLLVAWLARFGSGLGSVASPLILLAIYEPLALLFGLGGLVWAIRRNHRFGVLLGVWAGVGMLLLTLMPARMALDTLWMLLPLAMLTGVVVERLAQSLREQGDWLGEGLYVPVVIVLWAHFYLMLARYAVFGDPANLALALITVALQGLLAVIFALAKFDTAWRAVTVGTGFALVAITLSAGWGIAYARPSDPRELLAREPTSVEVRDLLQTLRDLSWRETGLPTTLPFTVETAPDSVLAWYLRDFCAVRQVENLDVGEEMDVVLVTARRDLHELAAAGVSSDVAIMGQDFVLRRSWDPLEIGCAWEWPPRCQAAVGLTAASHSHYEKEKQTISLPLCLKPIHRLREIGVKTLAAIPVLGKMPSRRRDFPIAKGVLHGAMCAIGKSRLQNGNC